MSAQRPRFASAILVSFLLSASAANAGVIVDVIGNEATGTVSLSDGVNSYDAVVTITFDSGVSNLTPGELNLTAQIMNPTDPALIGRLPGCLPLSACVSIDPAFPMMITVEPLNVVFVSGFETGETNGDMSFVNTYTVEVHTADLTYVDPTPYRLFKAPVGGAFEDISSAVLNGSVRARGTGGSFSQFLVVSDQRYSSSVAQQIKAPALRARILAATLTPAVNADLLVFMTGIESALLISDYATALADLDQMKTEILSHAGVDIANVWSSDHSLINDAGEMLALANTLGYTLVRLQSGLGPP